MVGRLVSPDPTPPLPHARAVQKSHAHAPCLRLSAPDEPDTGPALKSSAPRLCTCLFIKAHTFEIHSEATVLHALRLGLKFKHLHTYCSLQSE